MCLVDDDIAVSASSYSWTIEPSNTFAQIILIVLFFYLFFRHFLFVLMCMDIVISWLRKFSWFPKEGRRFKAFIHWLIALGLLIGFLFVGDLTGWLEFIPQ